MSDISSDRKKQDGEGKSHKSTRTGEGHAFKPEEQGNRKTDATKHQE